MKNVKTLTDFTSNEINELKTINGGFKGFRRARKKLVKRTFRRIKRRFS